MNRTRISRILSTAITAVVATLIVAGTQPMHPVEAAPPKQIYVNPETANWQTAGGGNGTDMYLAPVGGSRLGIGTDSPKQMLHVMSGQDANLTDGTGFVIIGSQDDKNIVFDDNEIMARNDGAPSPLYVQARGGRFTVGPDNGINVSIEDNALWAKNNGAAIPILFNQGTDVGPDLVSGYIIVGDRLAHNIAIDGNELMARNNGDTATLHVQAEGGAFAVQQDTLYVTPSGHVGIGTTDPLGISGFGDGCAYPCSNLAVSGNIHSSGTIATSSLWSKVSVNIGHNLISRPGMVAAPELAVDGTIYAREIIVTSEGWADFVFNDDYDLMPLSEVEAAIQAQGHLPGVPSEAEIVEQGIDLAAMNRTLMQKVEELTLYTIEQDKRISQLEEQMAQLLAAQQGTAAD